MYQSITCCLYYVHCIVLYQGITYNSNLSCTPQNINLFCLVLTQNSNLDGELTKLRAQLERGEAVRQNLEYELAKSRKECELEKTTAASRESLITDVNDTMKSMPSRISFVSMYSVIKQDNQR